MTAKGGGKRMGKKRRRRSERKWRGKVGGRDTERIRVKKTHIPPVTVSLRFRPQCTAVKF